MIIFDGVSFAAKKEVVLKQQVRALAAEGKHIVIAAILFSEDFGSQLYTRLKKEAANRIGIEYRVYEHRIIDAPDAINETILKLNQDQAVTGIIIQKPRRSTWLLATEQVFADTRSEQHAYQEWWRGLTSKIITKKDVDGLRPDTLLAIQDNTWQVKELVLPATCQAVLDILQVALVLPASEHPPKVLVIGRSDILGLPVTYALQNLGCSVENVGMLGFKQLVDSPNGLKDFQVIVSATGVPKLVHEPGIVRQGVTIIDVGEPFPDVDQAAIASVAGFITPVPGGVGPVTVVSLLENAVRLAK